jgi:hypothetical protein
VPAAAATDDSLLQNTDVLKYLEELGKAAEAGRPLSDRTDNMEFRAGVMALDEGLPDGDVLPSGPQMTFAEPALSHLADEPLESRDSRDLSLRAALDDAPVKTLVFLSCMFAVGAVSAALMFRDPLLRIFGW